MARLREAPSRGIDWGGMLGLLVLSVNCNAQTLPRMAAAAAVPARWARRGGITAGDGNVPSAG
jgi:hypothetical protein